MHSGEEEVEGNKVKLLSLLLCREEMFMQKSSSIRPSAAGRATLLGEEGEEEEEEL